MTKETDTERFKGHTAHLAVDRAGVNVVDADEPSVYVIAHCKGSTLKEVSANAALFAAAPALLRERDQLRYRVLELEAALRRVLEAPDAIQAIEAHDKGYATLTSKCSTDAESSELADFIRGTNHNSLRTIHLGGAR